jgi:hypothetical protein
MTIFNILYILIFSLFVFLDSLPKLYSFRHPSILSTKSSSIPSNDIHDLVPAKEAESLETSSKMSLYSHREFGSTCKTAAAASASTVSSEDMIDAKTYYDTKIKRYCYFDRGLPCSSMHAECRIDSRPCMADRSYLDHIYGTHNFPTIAKISSTSNQGQVTTRNVDLSQTLINTTPRGSQSFAHMESNGVASSSRMATTEKGVSVSHNEKEMTLVSSSLSWIEQTIVATIRIVFRVATGLITLIFSRPLDSNEPNPKNSQPPNTGCDI